MSKIGAIFLIIVVSSFSKSDVYTAERKKMVEEQIIARGIKDIATIKAMQEVSRHLFVPEEQMHVAYTDKPLNIGYGQTISQPYIVAYMTEILDLKKDFKVLEIGTGCGYQAAILAQIVDEVYTIEIIPELGKDAQQRLKSLNYENIKVIIGDGYLGYKSKAPYDAIIVTAATEHIPPALISQLKEGGKMIIPVGSQYYSQKLTLVEINKTKVKTKTMLPVRFVPFTRQ